MMFLRHVEGVLVMGPIRDRTTVPRNPQKTKNESYKKKVCIGSRLFPLGAPVETSPEGPTRFSQNETLAGSNRNLKKPLVIRVICCAPGKHRSSDLFSEKTAVGRCNP